MKQFATITAVLLLACAGCSPAPPAAPKYPLKAECPMCGGSGGLDEQLPDGTRKPIACDNCNGSGERPVYPWEKRIPCEPCKSAGIVNGIECVACEGLGWTPKYDVKLMGAEPLTQAPDATAQEVQGRVLDGHRVRNWWNKPRPMIDGAKKAVVGFMGLPRRVVEAIIGCVIGLFSLCCLGLFVVVFSVVTWAVVSLVRRPA